VHAGDHIQIRHTIPHPDHGQVRNGTSAHVTRVDPRTGLLGLQFPDGTRLQLSQSQIAEADLRLAYVQHPFPAQGQTTDTAHLIVAEHATREGTYVAITRAREQTHIYAREPDNSQPDPDGLHELAERLSRTEPDLPSIRVPLSQERIGPEAVERARDCRSRPTPRVACDRAAEWQADVQESREDRAVELSEEPQQHQMRDERLELWKRERDRSATAEGTREIGEPGRRSWPKRVGGDVVEGCQHDQRDRDLNPGWEP
jgi:hypothetical protein